jgi:hypothetical protein
MASTGDADDRAHSHECKCYKVLSTQPVSDKYEVFDLLHKFLQSDKERQLSKSSSLQGGGEERDLVREKASWNELRRWANALIDGDDDENLDKRKRRTLINDWVNDQRHSSYDDDPGNDAVVMDENRVLSDGMIKLETTEMTSRAEVSIVGRGLNESFVDHDPFELDGIDDARKKKESREAKQARKKAKKEAKKAKKEAKKMEKKEKKESKKRKREDSS